MGNGLPNSTTAESEGAVGARVGRVDGSATGEEEGCNGGTATAGALAGDAVGRGGTVTIEDEASVGNEDGGIAADCMTLDTGGVTTLGWGGCIAMGA